VQTCALPISMSNWIQVSISPIRFRSLSRTSILYPISVSLVSRLERQPHPRSGRSRNDADSARGSSFGNSPELWIGVQVGPVVLRSEEHTSELQSRENLVC